MESDPLHPIVAHPHRYQIGALHYHVGLDGTEPFLDIDLHLGNEVRRLRFWSPEGLVIEEGFPSPTGGLEILDVRGRQLDRLKVRVRDFEASRGKVEFWARDVVDRDTLEFV